MTDESFPSGEFARAVTVYELMEPQSKQGSRKKNGLSTGKERFGTFAGVFAPTFLTIIGIILFLRLGWVVGQVGLAGILAVIALAHAISVSTGLALSSIATNMAVKTGGTYYMISRTLGLEIGGAIGIPLYLSQAISVAFYTIGFADSFVQVYAGIDTGILSTAIILLFGLLSYSGADVAFKVQFLIMGALVLALVSFFCGGWGTISSPALLPPDNATASFWAAFAIFFPAVTGITVGVSMSGDLKDPIKSIPRGTMSAIAVAALIYVVAAVWLSTHATSEELISDTFIIKKIAQWPALIVLGVWAATLSSSLGSVLAAPRTLEAISSDGVVPKVLAARLGSPTEPRLAVILTSAIAVSIVWMGDLDSVATVITMFFLNTYGMINLTAGVEIMVGNPSFRPAFKVPWIVCLIGALGCYGTMFLISPGTTALAIVVSYGIYVVLHRKALRQQWGDVRSGMWFGLCRFALGRLEESPWHVKNWRPNVIVFTSIVQHRDQLMEVGSWLSSARGTVTFQHLLVGDVGELAAHGFRDASLKVMRQFLMDRGTRAFAESAIVKDLYDGKLTSMQVHGIGGLEPNTALMGWGNRSQAWQAQLTFVKDLMSLKKSAIFLKFDADRGFGRKELIDVWWRGKDRNGELMLLLAHIIAHSPAWEGAKIRLIRRVSAQNSHQAAEESLKKLLRSVRVEAELVTIAGREPGEPFTAMLTETSEHSDLVLLGLGLPEPSNLETQANYVNDVLRAAPTVLLVRSGETEDLL